MLTKNDLKLLQEVVYKIFNEIIDEHFQRLDKRLDGIVSGTDSSQQRLQNISDKLDTFLTLLKLYEKKQIILEKKLEAIEDYFEPRKN